MLGKNRIGTVCPHLMPLLLLLGSGGAARDSGRNLPCCTIPMEARRSLDLDLNHPIISPQGLPNSKSADVTRYICGPS